MTEPTAKTSPKAIPIDRPMAMIGISGATIDVKKMPTITRINVTVTGSIRSMSVTVCRQCPEVIDIANDGVLDRVRHCSLSNSVYAECPYRGRVVPAVVIRAASRPGAVHVEESCGRDKEAQSLRV